MNEWPTRVRTGTPPFSAITSGTAREQIRLCRIVAPGWERSVTADRIAVVVEPGQSGAGLVDHEDAIGVAVERQADVEAAGHHAGPQVALVGRLQRVGRVVRERAVELGIHDLELEHAEAIEHGGDDEAAHPVGGVGDDPPRAQGVDVDERHDVVDEVGEQVLLAAPPGPLRRRRAASVEDVARSAA